jgi:hypothetical protein
MMGLCSRYGVFTVRCELKVATPVGVFQPYRNSEVREYYEINVATFASCWNGASVEE